VVKGVGRRGGGLSVAGDSDAVTVLLGGDVMLGRGVDQILAHPGNPALREPYVDDARRYVGLAEKANGPIPRPVDWSWPWGDSLAILEDLAPEVRLINLETTITADGEFADRKAIHYRMHPDNLPALTAIRPDVCALANNHILDFGRRGLANTLDALASAGIYGIGAGTDLETAHHPAAVTGRGEHRVVIGGHEIQWGSRIVGGAPRHPGRVVDLGSVGPCRRRRRRGKGTGAQAHRRCRDRVGALGIQLGPRGGVE
jgi:poly-gamma-glutamate capsule biosynthesis protein CapA/YwtB (metallophosphatase superfamily)